MKPKRVVRLLIGSAVLALYELLLGASGSGTTALEERFAKVKCALYKQE